MSWCCKIHEELLLWRRNRVGAWECPSVGVGWGLCEHGMIFTGVTKFVWVQQAVWWWLRTRLELVSKFHEGVTGHNNVSHYSNKYTIQNLKFHGIFLLQKVLHPITPSWHLLTNSGLVLSLLMPMWIMPHSHNPWPKPTLGHSQALILFLPCNNIPHVSCNSDILSFKYNSLHIFLCSDLDLALIHYVISLHFITLPYSLLLTLHPHSCQYCCALKVCEISRAMMCSREDIYTIVIMAEGQHFIKSCLHVCIWHEILISITTIYWLE